MENSQAGKKVKKLSYSRRYFTIIEMMIVITILVIFTGVIGINVAKAMREQQFNTEVNLVVERLRLAQNLMLVLNRDVKTKVRAATKQEGLELILEVEGGVSKEWQFVIDRARIVLTTIHAFAFDDLQGLPKNPNEVEIRFLSGGSVMSRGVIHLSSHENSNDSGAMNAAIILYGYPHPIESVAEESKPITLVDEDRDFDASITNYTVEELRQYDAIQQAQRPTKEKNQPKDNTNKPPETLKKTYPPS